MQDTMDKYWEAPESRRLEFKETFPEGDGVARSVVAFANGAGGKLVFGIKDSPRCVTGIPDDQLFKMEEKISAHIYDLCEPAVIPEIYIQSVEGKTLLVVEIFPGSQRPYYLKNKGKAKGTYIRIGSSNRIAGQESIEELERRCRNISFDSIPVYDCGLDDIDLSDFLSRYKEETGKILLPEHLKNMGLMVCERDRLYYTHAALLMSSGISKKRYFPYAKIECARFKGRNTQVFLDQMTFDGPLYGASDACIDFIKRNIALSSTIGHVYREDTWEYPLNSVREAVNNAIIHRDYSLMGSDIKIAIFDDMLEITSPGPLPDTLPVEKLGSGRSEIRNRILAPVLKDLKLIEGWGTGIVKMKLEVASAPGLTLIFNETAHTFQVQFIKSSDKIKGRAESGQSQGRVRAESNGIEERIMGLLATGPLSKQELAERLGFDHITGHLNRTVKGLRVSGRIRYTIPEKPNTRFQKYERID